MIAETQNRIRYKRKCLEEEAKRVSMDVRDLAEPSAMLPKINSSIKRNMRSA